MNLATPAGHVAFGILWTLAMLALVVGFAGVGGLRFAPWLLLLIPFGVVRIGLQRDSSSRSAVSEASLRVGSFIVEAAMVAIFVYLYNLAVLSFCPSPRCQAAPRLPRAREAASRWGGVSGLEASQLRSTAPIAWRLDRSQHGLQSPRSLVA